MLEGLYSSSVLTNTTAQLNEKLCLHNKSYQNIKEQLQASVAISEVINVTN